MCVCLYHMQTPLGRPVQVLQRLTVSVNDPSHLHTLVRTALLNDPVAVKCAGWDMCVCVCV